MKPKHMFKTMWILKEIKFRGRFPMEFRKRPPRLRFSGGGRRKGYQSPLIIMLRGSKPHKEWKYRKVRYAGWKKPRSGG